MSQRVKAGCSKPAIASCSLTVSALAIENGTRAAGGLVGLLRLLEVLIDHLLGAVYPGLSSFRRQTEATKRPPGRSDERMLRSA